MDETNPLWMPKGSVRAILAIGITAATVSMWFVGHTVTPEQFGTMIAIDGFYFGSRQFGSNEPQTAIDLNQVDLLVKARQALSGTS